MFIVKKCYLEDSEIEIGMTSYCKNKNILVINAIKKSEIFEGDKIVLEFSNNNKTLCLVSNVIEFANARDFAKQIITCTLIKKL